MNCLYIMYLTDISISIVISKERLSVIFDWYHHQRPFCSDLVFSRVLSFFEISTCSHPIFQRQLICNSSCSLPFDEQQNKRTMQPNILSNLLYFCRTRIVARRFIVTNYDTLVSGMYILKEVCYLTTSIAAIHFLWQCHYFMGAVKAICFEHSSKDDVFSSCKKGSVNLAYVVPKLAKVWHIGFIENVK